MEQAGNTNQAGEASVQAQILCEADDGFKNWMSAYSGSLVFATCRSGKLCFLGWDGQMVTLLMRQMDLPTGLEVLRGQILVSCRHEISLFTDAPLLAYEYDPKKPKEYDACFLPRASWHIGDLGAGDIFTDQEGILFINTRFSCISRPSFKYHFETFWKPKFITEIVPEDRCHLSGATSVNGRLAYVTAFSSSNEHFGWRDNPYDGGILIDARTNETILEGLRMPCSPRWYKECLWFLNSGAGELCVMNPETRETKTVCHLPGLTHGLTFHGNHAIVGISRIRKPENFDKISIRRLNNTTYCGVCIVNILTGRTDGMFVFEQGCDEITDLALLPGVHRAMILTTDRPDCFDALTTEKYSWWIRPE